MTTDNRTNEPTPEQVEAAARVMFRQVSPTHNWVAQGDYEKYPWLEDAREVLKAAQEAAPQAECSERPGGRPCEASRPGHKLHWSNGPGAAPQAEGVPKSTYISPNLPAQIRGLYRADLREKSIQTMLDLAGDLIQELIDLRAAPAPSSGVDEDKLAEVERAAAEKAWERGVDDICAAYAIVRTRGYVENPYRQERKEQ